MLGGQYFASRRWALQGADDEKNETVMTLMRRDDERKDGEKHQSAFCGSGLQRIGFALFPAFFDTKKARKRRARANGKSKRISGLLI